MLRYLHATASLVVAWTAAAAALAQDPPQALPQLPPPVLEADPALIGPPAYGPRPAATPPAESVDRKPPPKKAKPNYNRWERRPLGVEAVLGLGGPVGVFGVALDYAASPMFVINTGVGLGLDGPQVALTPRIRLPVGKVVGFGVEGGVSTGPYKELCLLCTDDQRKHVPMATWFNMGGVFDLRTGGGFHFRLFGGAERILNGDSARYVESGKRARLRLKQIPYFGFGMGGAIEL